MSLLVFLGVSLLEKLVKFMMSLMSRLVLVVLVQCYVSRGRLITLEPGCDKFQRKCSVSLVQYANI